MNPLAIIGGSYSIQGFDHEGDEKFWNVTGDNASALCFCDINNDGIYELLVGSDDYKIRAFQNEDILFEISETGKVSELVPLHKSKFIFTLTNGSCGVYEGKKRLLVKYEMEKIYLFITIYYP